jgi:uncharacterized protein (DUF488 family)
MAPRDDSRTWVGSLGYERHRDVRKLAAELGEAGVERLIDVRELANSRRPGFSKRVLGAALEDEGIDYLHVRELGNPKASRGLYRSGEIAAGREAYRRLLLGERREVLVSLAALLRERRSALMCVEGDPRACHRDVIFASLRRELGMRLEVVELP